MMKTDSDLIDFFNKNFPMNKDGLSEFVDSFEKEFYSKGDIILKPYRKEQKIKFIQEGYIREYYKTETKEVNINFYGASQFSTDLNSFFQNSTTNKWQQCLTDVKALSLSKIQLEVLLKKYNCANSAIKLSFQHILNAKDSLEYKQVTLTIEELYKELLDKKPDWLNNIPQYHIASFLKITPETLSRVRKRIY